jgi:hypothetical protein
MSSWLRNIFAAPVHETQTHATAAPIISSAGSRRRDDPAPAPNLAPQFAPDRAMIGAVFQLPTEIDFAQSDGIRLFAARVRADGTEVRRIWAGNNAPLDPPTAEEHAYLLLRYLQSQPLISGHEVPASDLKELYRRFCRSLGLRKRSWQSVAKHLRFLTGGARHYRRVNGPNVRVYPIPPAQSEA